MLPYITFTLIPFAFLNAHQEDKAVLIKSVYANELRSDPAPGRDRSNIYK
jgi:hypothetical protein